MSVGQADVQRIEPHLGHNYLSCGVFLVKSRPFGLPLAQTILTKLAISLSGRLIRYTNVEYPKSIPEETRAICSMSERVITRLSFNGMLMR